MGVIDTILGVILGYGAYKGLKNGLFVELASGIAFFVGIYMAVTCSKTAAPYLQQLLGTSTKTTAMFAFVLILVAVIIGIHFLAKSLSALANGLAVGWLNRLGGALFGTLKMCLILGVVLTFFQKINSNSILLSQKEQEDSLFFSPIVTTSDALLPVVKNVFTNLKNTATAN